jgi:hypothetical protein
MPQLSRRAFVRGLPLIGGSLVAGGLIGGAPAPALGATQDTAATPVSVTPLAQIRIGRFTVTALTDGYADMPYDYFPGRAAAEVEQAAIAQFTARPSGVRFLFNQSVSGRGWRALHPDRCRAGRIDRADRRPATSARRAWPPARPDRRSDRHAYASGPHGGLIVGVRTTTLRRNSISIVATSLIGPTPPSATPRPIICRRASKWRPRSCASTRSSRRLTASARSCGGVSIVDLTGHTPGHIGVRIEDGGQSLIMVSDMIFPVVHPGATDVFFLFEQDRAAAKAMRDSFFPRAASEGALIAATHMPFPGLGRVVADRGQMRWQVADWALQN